MNVLAFLHDRYDYTETPDTNAQRSKGELKVAFLRLSHFVLRKPWSMFIAKPSIAYF